MACWAHARRKFFDAMKSDARRAQIALASSVISTRWRSGLATSRKPSAVPCGKGNPAGVIQLKAWLDDEQGNVRPRARSERRSTMRARNGWR